MNVLLVLGGEFRMRWVGWVACMIWLDEYTGVEKPEEKINGKT
jgi:hypothetical protein